MARDVDYDILINYLEAAIEQTKVLNLTHTETLLRMAVLDVADVLSGGRVMKPKKYPRRRRTS